MNKTFPVITLNQHIYGIDPEAEIKEGDWVYDALRESVWQKSEKIACNGKIYSKILFSSDESLGLPVPVMEDEVERLAIEKYPHSHNSNGKEDIVNSVYRDCFIAAYQTNPCKFTEEDMINFTGWLIAHYIKKYDGFIHRKGSIDAEPKPIQELLKMFFSSLKPKIVSMEVEMRMGAIVEPVLCIKTDDSNKFIPVKINYTSLGEK